MWIPKGAYEYHKWYRMAMVHAQHETTVNRMYLDLMLETINAANPDSEMWTFIWSVANPLEAYRCPTPANRQLTA